MSKFKVGDTVRMGPGCCPEHQGKLSTVTHVHSANVYELKIRSIVDPNRGARYIGHQLTLVEDSPDHTEILMKKHWFYRVTTGGSTVSTLFETREAVNTAADEYLAKNPTAMVTILEAVETRKTAKPPIVVEPLN